MHEFKFLNITNFEPLLKIYGELASNLDSFILIETIFLQIYAKLEEALYLESEQHPIKKNASITRFELALIEQGYDINNEHWRALVSFSKIRNCLLHGNGRIDADRYGMDTAETINLLNAEANATLIQIIPVNSHSKIKLDSELLNYCLLKIKGFIECQLQNE